MVKNKDIQDIVKSIVDDIDKTILIDKIENADLIQTKLFVCSLKWLRVGSVVLDDQDRDAVVTEIGDNYIVVQKTNPFTWTSKILTIVKDIYWFTGTPRATNGEWLEDSTNEDNKTPFVWLVEPTNETFFNSDQGLERESNLRIYFLDQTQPKYTTSQHHELVIKPLRAWVDAFLVAIDKNEDFARFDSYDLKALSRFGVESPQGFEANIIDSNLSAIELRFNLPIRKNAKCLC